MKINLMKFFNFFSKIFKRVKSHQSQVNKGLSEINDLGLGPKS